MNKKIKKKRKKTLSNREKLSADAKKLEQITSRIYQMLSPNHRVTHNDKINGRQIDVSIRTTVSGHEILIIVNTKNQSRRVNINQVGELYAVMVDTKAHIGVIICNQGFTEGAKRASKKFGIDLCHIHDAETKDWRSEIKLPIILEEVLPNLSASISFNAYLHTGMQFDTNAILTISNVNIVEKIITEWNMGKISANIDQQIFNLEIDNQKIKTLQGIEIPIENLHIEISLKRSFYFGYFDVLPTAKALVNDITNKTELIIPYDDIKNIDLSRLIKIDTPENAPVPIVQHLRILKLPQIKEPISRKIEIRKI